MELLKKQIHCNKIGKKIFDQFYIDEDYNVPDTKSDVLRVVQGEGYIKVEEIKSVENYLRIIGKLYFQILYVTEEGEPRLAALEGRMPFEEMVYTEDDNEDHFFIRSARVEFHATIIHSRKLDIKAMVELEISREEIKDEEVTIDVDDNTTSLFKKKRQMELLQMHTCKKDTYRVKEEVTIPGTKENIASVLLTNVSSRKLDVKLGQDELLLKGEFQVFCMYLSEEFKEDWIEVNVPFEGRVECYGVDEHMYHHIVSSLEDPNIDIRMDEDGEMRVLGIEGTLELRIQVYEEEVVEILEDVYSLEEQCHLERKESIYEELLLRNQSKCKVIEQLSLPEVKDDILQICHSSGVVQVEHMELVDGGVQIEGILHISFLYIKSNDEVPFDTWQGMVPFSYLLEGSHNGKEVCFDIDSSLEQLSVTMSGSEEVEVKAVLSFNSFLRTPITLQVITNMEFTPLATDEMNKRAGIVGYIVKDGDDLWSLAKRHYTTIEGIKEINGLSGEEIKQGDKILIFKENMSIL